MTATASHPASTDHPAQSMNPDLPVFHKNITPPMSQVVPTTSLTNAINTIIKLSQS